MSYEIAVLVSTFERPRNLERCLASIEQQRDVDGRFEVVVTDDGSRDDTLELVAAIAGHVKFPLRTTTHDHQGFRLARCRNEGAAASTAPYLLFTDGDCVLPPDHLRIHLQERRPEWVISSDCIKLDEEASGRVDVDMVRRGKVSALIPLSEKWRISRKAIRAKLYEWARVSMRPRLTGNNIALWRKDFERVNGFDERFVGWGFEDRDLQDRLERAGLRVRSILWHAATIHLWHAPDASFVRNGIGTANRLFFETSDRPVFCADGLVKDSAGRAEASASLPSMLVGGIS
jgi:glycosyltransferase involved in cell wall biosynthesis